MATRTITAQAVIKAQDQTSGVFASIAGRARAMMRSLAATSGRIGSAQAVRARANEATQRAGQIPARNRARADALAASRGGYGVGSGALLAAGARYIPPAAAAYGAGKSFMDFADAERSLTRIGITAGATREELASTMQSAQKLAFDTAQPFQKIVEGMDTLAAQGRTMKEVRDFIPAVARTAQASGAEVADIAKSADAVGTHLKVTSEQMQEAFDIMAAAGKAGSFELKDMARYLPSMLPAAKALGVEGTKGLRDITAMLQIIRKGTGTAEEAASSMQNIFAKMESEETTKRFKKFGIDLRKEMETARKGGKNLLEVFEGLTNKAVKGDLSKIPQLFSDMGFARGMRAILAQRGEWQKMSADIARTAPGTVDRDLGPVIDSTRGRIDQMSASFDNASRALGAFIAIPATPVLEALAQHLEEAAKGWDLLNEKVKKRHERNKDTKFPESIDPPWVQEWERRYGIAPRVPDAGNIMRDMVKTYAEQQRKDNEFTGGNSFRGTAFGPGGFSPKAYGGSIVGGYYDPNIPHPPRRPAEITPPRASSSDDVGRAITGGAASGGKLEAIVTAPVTAQIPPQLAGDIAAAIKGSVPAGRLGTDTPSYTLNGGGKLEAVVTAPVTAQLSGSANVEGTVRVESVVKVDAGGLAQEIRELKVLVKGALNAARGNGPGSTGKSSPDASAGGTGSQ